MSGLKAVCAIVCVATLSCGIRPLFAEDPSKAGPSTQPAMDQAAMMAAWMKAAKPGPEHANMAKAVGTWDCEMTDMTAGTPGGDKSTGTAVISMIMDGRYMKEEFSGMSMGMQLNGQLLMGFDNVTKEYTSVWVDNGGTGIAVAHGKMSADGSLELDGKMSDPMSGKAIDTKQVITHEGADQSTMKMYMPGPDGKEMMAFQIVYKRHK